MARVRVCSLGELNPGEVIRVEAEVPVAVVNVDGEFFAVEDTCTHAESSLAEGWIEGDTVQCAYHMARFNLRTGAVLSLPATQPLRTYPVTVDDDQIYVMVDGQPPHGIDD